MTTQEQVDEEQTAYIKLMNEDLEKINTAFGTIIASNKFYNLKSLHNYIFGNKTKPELTDQDTYQNFQKHYRTLQKFVYYTYIKNLPVLTMGIDLTYPTDLTSQLKNFMEEAKIEENYLKAKNEKIHFLEITGSDSGVSSSIFNRFFSADGSKKKVKKSPRKKSKRKRSKKRSKVIYLK